MSFWKYRAKSDRADALFSRYIRLRDKNKCQRCGADGRLKQMDNSHFFGRGSEATRFEPSNCDLLCRFPCHDEWEHEKWERLELVDGKYVTIHGAYRQWKINQLGEARFSLLEVQANTNVKKDRKMSLLVVKALLSELERKESVIGRKA